MFEGDHYRGVQSMLKSKGNIRDQFDFCPCAWFEKKMFVSCKCVWKNKIGHLILQCSNNERYTDKI